MLRVGLVGIGDAGRHHARALLAVGGDTPDVRWSAVVARHPERLARFREELAVPDDVRAFASLDALLEAGCCDAVILATPDGLHAEQAAAALHRGVALLVEKPLALRPSEGERAVALARAANVRLQVGYHLRHHAAHRLALELLPTHAGTLRSVHVRWAWPDPARDGWRAGGLEARSWSLAALGTHGIDLALAAGGVPAPSALRVVGLRSPAHGTDEAAEVSFALASGALAHVSVSIAHRAESRVVWTGDAGELEARGTLGARGGGRLVARSPRGDEIPLTFEPQNPYEAQLRHFALRAPFGFEEDSAVLANLAILDVVAPENT